MNKQPLTLDEHRRSGANRLPILAAGINDHLAAAEAATKRGLEHAIAAGALLTEAKGLVDHGDWLPWLEAHCRVGARQAQTFMRLARNRHKLDAIKNEFTAHLTIATAEALVGRPKPERPHGLPGQMDMLGGQEVTAAPQHKATNAADIALSEFDGHILRLVQMTREAKPDRFAKDGTAPDELERLGEFLIKVAMAKRARS